MRFNVFGADFLPDWLKEVLLDKQSSRINAEGELVITSQRTRSQANNRVDALRKMQEIIDVAATLPLPPSAGMATPPIPVAPRPACVPCNIDHGMRSFAVRGRLASRF